MVKQSHVAAGRRASMRGDRRIDIHVGSRLRFRRRLLGMSQRQLGERLGLSNQQIQKHEKGTAIISAGRLFELAQALGVTVQFFFEDAAAVDRHQSAARGCAGGPDLHAMIEFLGSRDSSELNRAFVAITRPGTRRAIVGLARSLATPSKGSMN